MNNFLRRTIEDFNNLERLDNYFVLDTVYKIKEFVIPILRCCFRDDEAIDLENKIFRYLDPVNFFYYALSDREYFHFDLLLKKILRDLDAIFLRSGYKFQYLKRIKSAYSSMNRIRGKDLFLLDKFGIRIIFDIDSKNFYQFAWWIVINLKENFEIVQVKDYIASPCKTGYSALHVLISTNQIFIEIQIMYLQDAAVKLPHFCYKQHISQNNLYIAENAHSAKEKILQDFKNYLKCQS